MKKVIIIGNGGHGKVIADIVRLNGDDIFGFLDDKNPKIPGLRILGNTDSIKLFDIEEFFFFVAIGDNRVRKKLMESAAVRWYTAIHPSAVIAGDTEIGPGTCVVANAVINSNTKIGTGVIINTAATVDHDSIIGDFTHVCPGTHLGGTVHVGDGCFIGIGSRVINNINICSDVIIGAGGVVIRNITEPGTYVGVPVRKLEKTLIKQPKNGGSRNYV